MQEGLFTVAKLDDFVPEDDPLRGVRLLVNTALMEMSVLAVSRTGRCAMMAAFCTTLEDCSPGTGKSTWRLTPKRARPAEVCTRTASAPNVSSK